MAWWGRTLILFQKRSDHQALVFSGRRKMRQVWPEGKSRWNHKQVGQRREHSPTRKTNIPCHTKLDTECIFCQIQTARKELPTTNLGVVPCFKVGLDLTLVDKRGVSAVQRNFETVLTSVSLKEKAERSRANQVLTLHTESCKVWTIPEMPDKRPR